MAYKKGMRSDLDCDPDHLAILKRGKDEWNTWREANPGIVPSLGGIDFTDELVFGDSIVWRSERAGTVKPKSKFVDLSGYDFSKAYMRGCDFSRANLHDCDFSGSILVFANFENSDPWGVDLTGADLGGANLSEADFGGVVYDRRRMRRNYLSVRGSDAIVGDSVFRRDVLDQEYLDSIDFRIKRKIERRGVLRNSMAGFTSVSPIFGLLFGLVVAAMASLVVPEIEVAEAAVVALLTALLFGFLRSPFGERMFFWVWGLFDYGRSWRRVATFGLATIVLFGFVFSLLIGTHLDFPPTEGGASNFLLEAHPLHPYVYAAAGFVSGGLLSIAAVKTNLGLLVVLLNGILGVATFGLLLSALTTTFARQG